MGAGLWSRTAEGGLVALGRGGAPPFSNDRGTGARRQPGHTAGGAPGSPAVASAAISAPGSPAVAGAGASAAAHAGPALAPNQAEVSAHARLIPVQLHSGRSLDLKIWVVREGQGAKLNTLNVLVINRGRRSALVDLHLPAKGRGFVQRRGVCSAPAGTLGLLNLGRHAGRPAPRRAGAMARHAATGGDHADPQGVHRGGQGPERRVADGPHRGRHAGGAAC
jgi:hypothetical protein